MSTFSDLILPSNLVESIWGDVALPDARLHSRLRKTVAMMIERLEAPVSCVPRKLVVGAHRLWNNARVKPESLVEPMLAHQAKMLTGALSLVVAHDTMEIDLTGRYQTEDSGPLRSAHACGHLLHWSLAIDPTTRRPLAAVACNVWTRPMETRKGNHASRPLEERESIKWKREIEACTKALSAASVDALLTHVFDREGDTHDNFLYAIDKCHRIITRAQQEHSIAEGPGTLGKLFATEGVWEREAICTREVPTKASEAAMKEARKKGRAEVQAVRDALTKMGGPSRGVAARALGAGDVDARRAQEEVDAASACEGVGGPGAGAECSPVHRAVGVDVVDDGARRDARRRVVGRRWVPRALAHRADAYGAQDGAARGGAEREGRGLDAAPAVGVVARLAAPDAMGVRVAREPAGTRERAGPRRRGLRALQRRSSRDPLAALSRDPPAVAGSRLRAVAAAGS